MNIKTNFLAILSVGLWLLPYNAVADDIGRNAFPIYNISYSFDESENPLFDKETLTSLSDLTYLIGRHNFNLRVMKHHTESKKFPFKTLAQMSPSEGLDEVTSNTTPVPEPATILLFGIGLILITESGRRLKKS